MIQQILQPFDWVVQMPIEDQCRYSIGLSFFGFCIAAVLREMCKDKHIRLAARALGAAAFFAVAAFAVHATKLVDRLEDVVASQPIKAQQITEQYLSAAYFETPKGVGINLEKQNDGRITSMLDFSGCCRRSDSGLSSVAGRSRRPYGEADNRGPVGYRSHGSTSKLLGRKPDESLHADNGRPEQF